MIRTHKPRGQAWNCASEFQQTQLFRDISYYEAEHIVAEKDYLEPADHDDFRLPERDAKRRRIEKLADDFLNGFPLEIHSATLDPYAVNDALVYCCFDRPRDAWDALEDVQYERLGEEENVWEDVRDGREVLRNFVKSNAPLADDGLLDQTASPLPVVIEVQASASCGPRTRLRSAKLLAGPSEDALRRAAQLRNRRLQKPALEVIESQPQSCPKPVIPETQTLPSFEESLEETVSDCGPSPTPAWTSSKWLKSGTFEVRRKDVDEDCSRDELGATTVYMPSQRSRNVSRPLARTKSDVSAPSNPSFNTAPPATAETTCSGSVMNNTQDRGEQYDTEQPGGDAQNDRIDTDDQRFDQATDHDPFLRHFEDHSDADSQDRLLRQKGINVRPRKSWATANTAPASPSAGAVPLQDEDAPSAAAIPPTSTLGGPVLGFANDASQNVIRSRKTKSTGTTPVQSSKEKSSRRRTAPVESQQVEDDRSQAIAERTKRSETFSKEYTAVNNHDGSPFMFRKRASKGKVDTPAEQTSAPPQQQVKTRRQTYFPSSDSPQKIGKREHGPKNGVPGEAAVPSPHTPLVDEHLNTILPRDALPGRRSSSVRKLLREELRASGAEITRCMDDAGSSQESQPHEVPTTTRQLPTDENENEAKNANATQIVVESQPQLWPGTQAMLQQAHKDLFTSPDKTDTALYLGDKSTPGMRPSSDPGTTARKPLRQLSQEQVGMPSTQAILDTWKGWSSIKKPTSDGRRSSLVQSPSIGKGSMKGFASDPVQGRESLDRRTSSLRYSLSFGDEPDQTPDKHQDSTLRASHSSRNTSDGFLKPAPKRTSAGSTSSLSFGVSSLDLPSPQAQPRLANPSRLQPNFQALNPPAETTASTLSFGASPLSLPQPPHADEDNQQEEPMTSFPNAQNPNTAYGNEDSQALYASITEITDEVLGSAREMGMGMSF